MIITMMIMASFTGIVAGKSSLAYADEIALTSNVPEKYPEYYPDNVTEVKTVGPSSFLIYAADITLIDGPFLKVSLIEMILGSRNFHFIFPNISINVNDLTFSIKYTVNLNQLPIFKRFFYKTTIIENGNVTSYTKKHTVIVTGFSGEFRLLRTKPFRLYPAHFWFKGTCEEAIVIT
jgi:hypothetical protein